MADLSAFFKQNKRKEENVKVAATESIIDPKTKEPILWEIRALRSGEADQLRMACSKYGKNGQKLGMDDAKFSNLIAARCTVFPDLNDKDLQDSYGAMSAEQLILMILDSDGEYQNYVAKILEISGYNKTMDELVSEAKN